MKGRPFLSNTQGGLQRNRENLRVFSICAFRCNQLSCRDPATRATLRHRVRRSWCQFCSCAFKLVVGHVRQQADSEQSTFAKHDGEQMRSTVAFAASVYHGPCPSAKHAPEFEREALFCLGIRSSRFLIGMPIPHATHVCRARTLERLTWGRRSAPRKALRRGLNRRPASSKPLQNSNASLF